MRAILSFQYQPFFIIRPLLTKFIAIHRNLSISHSVYRKIFPGQFTHNTASQSIVAKFLKNEKAVIQYLSKYGYLTNEKNLNILMSIILFEIQIPVY